MTQTHLMHATKEFLDICRSKALEVHDIYAVLPEYMMDISSTEDGYNDGNIKSNLATAVFRNHTLTKKFLI